MNHRSVSLVAALFLMLTVNGSVKAAEQPDGADDFRIPGSGAQGRLVSESSPPAAAPAASASVLTHPANMVTPQILDRTPVTLHYPPTLQVAQAAGASGTPATAAGAEPEAEGQSVTEVNKQLSNPVSTLWSFSMQFNNYQLVNNQWNYDMQFQPVLPVSLTKDWNLITRPVIPLYNSVPVPTGTGTFNQNTGLGDTILLEMFSPANTGPWLLGAGPTFIFPTATNKYTGQGKWQSGPAAVVGRLS